MTANEIWTAIIKSSQESRGVRINQTLSDQKQAGLSSHTFTFIWGSLVKAQKPEIYNSKAQTRERERCDANGERNI